MSRFRKFLVAAAGVVVTIAGRRYGLESTAYTDLIGVLTALGVYAVPNG
jgi:hypothetical protein